LEAAGAGLSAASMAAHGALVIGRFAPSPTGPLHFGSLVAALASYLSVKAQNGRWLVRIEDIDPPREPPGAANTILRQLGALGLRSDAAVLLQSQRLARYKFVLNQLIAAGLAFPCFCTRSQLAGRVHAGRCNAPSRVQPTWRLAVPPGSTIQFHDQHCGPQTQALASTVGDFVLWRSDGWPSYQLACVVDDADCGVTEIVRGMDLLDNTARQVFLAQCCQFPLPSYHHVPLVLGSDGQKLSKQNLAPALDTTNPTALLHAAFEFLRPHLATYGNGLKYADAFEALLQQPRH
jgi:glutamyl-Q tRNA(Asp) synthetase